MRHQVEKEMLAIASFRQSCLVRFFTQGRVGGSSLWGKPRFGMLIMLTAGMAWHSCFAMQTAKRSTSQCKREKTHNAGCQARPSPWSPCLGDPGGEHRGTRSTCGYCCGHCLLDPIELFPSRVNEEVCLNQLTHQLHVIVQAALNLIQ